MTTTESHRSPETLARIGSDIYERQIGPFLGPSDDGRFVAIDVGSGEHEIDEDDYTAVMRLHSRLPGSEVRSMMVGQAAANRVGSRS